VNVKEDGAPNEIAEDLGDRLSIAVANLEDLADRLRRTVGAILSHAIRRQHLPPGLTFDSELWDRLRDIGGAEACTQVTEEIQRTQSMLRRAHEKEGNRK
jgi:hypothetical protein